MSLVRLALIRDLARRFHLASLDELRVIDRIFLRLELGRDRYRPLDIATDKRDWRREFADELLDAVVYDTIETIRASDAEHEKLRSDVAAELELERWRREDRTTISKVPAQIAATAPEAADSGPVITYEWEDGEGPRTTVRGKP